MEKDFYFKYYAVIEESKAHARFCADAFGLDLCQHGFADLAQLKQLATAADIRIEDTVLEIGCGNGKITEYLSDATGARFTGLDYVPEAIRKAGQRTRDKASRLRFQVGNINSLALPAQAYSVILSIDSIYFSDDYRVTVSSLKGALARNGRMAFLYSYGVEPWIKAEDFPVAQLPPESTPLAQAFRANELVFSAIDLTPNDCALAARRRQILENRREDFEKEGIGFIYESRMGDARGIMDACRLGMHRRYLYVASPER